MMTPKPYDHDIDEDTHAPPGRRPIIELTQDSEVEMAWYASMDDSDVMALVYRDTAQAPWRATIRVRLYLDADAFDSKDWKGVTELLGNDGSDAARDTLVAAVDQAIDLYPAAQRFRVEIKGDTEAFMEIWQQQPFTHVAHTDTIVPGPTRPQ